MAIRPFRFLKRVLALLVGQGDQVLSITTKLDQISSRIQEEISEIRAAVCGHEDQAPIVESLDELARAVAALEERLASLEAKLPDTPPSPSAPAPVPA